MYALAHNFSRTVVATIHQPSSEVFQQFDDLIVLAEGEVRRVCHVLCMTFQTFNSTTPSQVVLELGVMQS